MKNTHQLWRTGAHWVGGGLLAITNISGESNIDMNFPWSNRWGGRDSRSCRLLNFNPRRLLSAAFSRGAHSVFRSHQTCRSYDACLRVALETWKNRWGGSSSMLLRKHSRNISPNVPSQNRTPRILPHPYKHERKIQTHQRQIAWWTSICLGQPHLPLFAWLPSFATGVVVHIDHHPMMAKTYTTNPEAAAQQICI